MFYISVRNGKSSGRKSCSTFVGRGSKSQEFYDALVKNSRKTVNMVILTFKPADIKLSKTLQNYINLINVGIYLDPSIV